MPFGHLGTHASDEAGGQLLLYKNQNSQKQKCYTYFCKFQGIQEWLTEFFSIDIIETGFGSR